MRHFPQQFFVVQESPPPLSWPIRGTWLEPSGLFVAVGYPVVPMPVPEGRALPLSPSAFLPQVPALQDSYYALHELIGLVWYRLRYGDW